MGRSIVAGRFIARCAPADMHDYYFSIRSTTGVGFHTVLGSPKLPVNEQVISFKMAKLPGWASRCRAKLRRHPGFAENGNPRAIYR